MRTRTRLVPLIASLVAAAGLATPLVHSQAAGDLAPPRLKYVITDLGLLPGTNQSVPTEINNRGEIIGVSCDTSSSTGCRSFLWSPQPSSRTVGAMADLQLRLPGHVSSEANDINDAGEVVGTSTEDRGTVPRFVGHAVRWRKGQLEELAIPGLSSSAESIDRTGQIVGAGGGGGWIWKEGALSFIKRSDGGSFVPVKTNNSGQIAGIGFTTFGMRGFLWQNGMTTDLGALSLNGSTAPNDINDAGVIVGQSDVEFRTSAGATIKIAHAFLWNGSIHDLGTLPVSPRTSPPPAVANGINDSNQVVGWAEADPLASDGTAGHAVLWQGGTPIDLNETIPADSGWILLRATAINNAGQIVGFGFKLPLSGDDPERAFLLTPVPCAESQDTDGNGNPDNDGDGLCDSWETEGIKASDGDMLLDLPKLGANRNHKDLFVEIDFMDCELQPSDCTDLHTHRPDPQALAAVRQAFADAPVGNPDGTTGITLHFEGDDIDQDGVNEAVPHATQISFRARDSGFNLVKLGPDLSPDGCDGHFGTFGDRFTHRSSRRPVTSACRPAGESSVTPSLVTIKRKQKLLDHREWASFPATTSWSRWAVGRTSLSRPRPLNASCPESRGSSVGCAKPRQARSCTSWVTR